MYAIKSFSELINKKVIYVFPEGEVTENLIIVTEDQEGNKGVLQACCCDIDTKTCVTMDDVNLSKLVVQGFIFQETSWHLYTEKIISLMDHKTYMAKYPELKEDWLAFNKDSIIEIQTSWYSGYRKVR